MKFEERSKKRKERRKKKEERRTMKNEESKELNTYLNVRQRKTVAGLHPRGWDGQRCAKASRLNDRNI